MTNTRQRLYEIVESNAGLAVLLHMADMEATYLLEQGLS
jgi:hypothetical protein